MGRPQRAAEGGIAYHLLNRANARMTIFRKPEDYVAFEAILEDAVERSAMRLLAYLVMPNHWHLVVWPQETGDLSRFTGWLTLTHTQRWHAHHQTTGSGHLYQGRFKSFPVQDDEHFLTVCRYVERNALRAGLVERAEAWRWSSLWRWHRGNAKQQALLASWPVRRSPNWIDFVNCADDRSGTQRDPPLDRARQPLRRRRLERQDGEAPRAGIHPPPPRPSPETRKRFLTPFFGPAVACSFGN